MNKLKYLSTLAMALLLGACGSGSSDCEGALAGGCDVVGDDPLAAQVDNIFTGMAKLHLQLINNCKDIGGKTFYFLKFAHESGRTPGKQQTIAGSTRLRSSLFTVKEGKIYYIRNIHRLCVT